jgi:glycosyltransferase involved in cell wall biosynthesis
MDVLAAPSRFEGFGLAAAEAMAVGKPVVGFRVGGLAELVENGVTGYLVEPANVEALAGVLVELLPDRERAAQMGRRGRLRVEKYFSFENFSKQIGLAYQALERKHDPAPRRQRDLRSWQFLA